MESAVSWDGLPPELQRHIFEICALSRPVSIPTLMLVASHVKEWVEPLLYRTVTFHDTHTSMIPAFSSKILAKTLKARPACFFEQAVRHLLLPGGWQPALDRGLSVQTLSVCTGIQNLWIAEMALEDMIPSLARLPLQHLYAHVLPLLRTLTPAHPFFSRITHLELLDLSNNSESWSGLSRIPHLTHLSFNDHGFILLCPLLLETCASLAVLICLNEKALWASSPHHSYAAGLSHDSRFVVMACAYYIKDWKMGVHAGQDYWSRAESFIAKRRSGEIDRLQYQISFDESENIV
ncbi:hypothetical protein C8R44DRAFT_991351 [Mycena epipterygia]|nr:hypothetical protein C8R44DRAFT_991351 [Mycena epipterygia]